MAGIDLTGKIALVKYGGNFRGLKIKGGFRRNETDCTKLSCSGTRGGRGRVSDLYGSRG
jgi:hypothetical protein